MTNVENLPAHKPIAEAIAAHEAAQADHLAKRRDVTQLEQERPAAEWKQANAISEARAAGKPDPKSSFVDEHDRLIDKARMELKVATLAERRAEAALADAHTEHGAAYRTEVETLAARLDKRWDEATAALSKLHAERRAAVSTARQLGSEHPPFRGIPVDVRREMVDAIELPSGANRVGHVPVETVLAKLSLVGTSQAEPEPVRTGMPDSVANKLAAIANASAVDGGAQREIEQREEYERHLRSRVTQPTADDLAAA